MTDPALPAVHILLRRDARIGARAGSLEGTLAAELLVVPMQQGSDDAPILVVEDDAALRRIIREVLEDEGFVVETAADGRQAVQRAASKRPRPALVVLDLALPRLSGARVAAELREAYQPPPPVLLITADGDAPRKARQVGAFAFLSKPLELDDLVAVVRRGLAAG